MQLHIHVTCIEGSCSLYAGADFENQNKYGENSFSLLLAIVLEMQCKFHFHYVICQKVFQSNPAKCCASAFAQKFETKSCWLFYQTSRQSVLRFCRNLELKYFRLQMSRLLEKITSLKGKNGKNVYQQIMKNHLSVKIL